MDQVLYSFSINPNEEVRCSLFKDDGKCFIDIRPFSKNIEGNFIPSDNGLIISTEFIDELALIINILISAEFMISIEDAFYKDMECYFSNINEHNKAVYEKGDYLYFKYRFVMAVAFLEYNASKEWAYVKQKVIERDDFTCVDCKTTCPSDDNGVIHHEHYDNWGRGDCHEIESCVFLCKKCHKKRHNKPDMKITVPFWAKRGALWDKCSGISEEVLENAMKNLRTGIETPSPTEPQPLKGPRMGGFQPRLPSL